MTTLRLDADDGHAVMTKLLAIARMNEIRVLHVSYDAFPGAEQGGSIRLQLDEGDAMRIDRVIARARQIVGVTIHPCLPGEVAGVP